MTIPKKHHFVPESYLKKFADEKTGFLYVYSKQKNHYRKQKPQQIMVRNKYYRQDWAPDGIDKNILEKQLGKELEPKGLRSLQKLIEVPEKLIDEDAASILIYLSFQRIRVPRQAEMAKSVAEAALRIHLLKTSLGRDLLKVAKINIKDSFRFKFMHIVLGELLPYMSRMIWEVVTAANGCAFVTSDSPVSFYNVNCIPPTEPGLGLLGTIVLFPLNSKTLLFMRHPELKNEKNASKVLPNINFEDGVIELRRGTVWGEDAVNSHNWRMLQLCDELIVAQSKEILEKAIIQ